MSHQSLRPISSTFPSQQVHDGLVSSCELTDTHICIHTPHTPISSGAGPKPLRLCCHPKRSCLTVPLSANAPASQVGTFLALGRNPTVVHPILFWTVLCRQRTMHSEGQCCVPICSFPCEGTGFLLTKHITLGPWPHHTLPTPDSGHSASIFPAQGGHVQLVDAGWPEEAFFSMHRFLQGLSAH